jgi:hypothetical protein
MIAVTHAPKFLAVCQSCGSAVKGKHWALTVTTKMESSSTQVVLCSRA